MLFIGEPFQVSGQLSAARLYRNASALGKLLEKLDLRAGNMEYKHMRLPHHIPARIPSLLTMQTTRYFELAILFFALSFVTILFVHNLFSEGQMKLPAVLFSPRMLSILLVLLTAYFLADGLRLYAVIRAMGQRIPFGSIFKLVFINIFVSNVTPLATGGGVAQVFFMQKQGMTLGEATAATSIRTMLAALVLFTLTPLFIWARPELFHVFLHQNLLIAITGVSCLYLFFFWIILFRVRLVKLWLYRILAVANRLGLVTDTRSRRLFLRLSQEMGLFSGGFNHYFSGNKFWVLLSLLCTLFFLLLLFSFSVVLIRGLGYQVPVLTILIFQVVVTFFMYFAPTPGASGVAEAGYGLLFAQLVNQHDITILTLSWRFLTIYIGVIIGIGMLYREVYKAKIAQAAGAHEA
jgi:uncharacterized protein (TIRG00374 family)